MVMAAAAPAFAQTAVGGDSAVLQYSCNQIQAAVNTQYQLGEGTGAVAGAAQSLGVDQNAVLACFGTAVAAQQSTINVNTADGGGGAKKVTTVTAKAGGGATATASPTASATATASAPAALPETGGASAIALGAAVLLVAGGLLARRIVR
jgi:hypothetical protein